MGKITRIDVQKRNKERFNIYIDEVYAFSVNGELVYTEKLEVNGEVDEEKLHKIAFKENLSKCKNTALRIIERSYKTEMEIKEKLIEKGYDLESILPTVDFLKEYSFIDDKEYIKLYIKDRIRRQGSQKIKYALIRKGIDPNEIEDNLTNINKEQEKDVALELVKKKYSQLVNREKDIYKISSKLYRFLVGRGYDYTLAKDVIKKTMNMDDIEGID
ncbi:recombination regulator RecX [Clostridium vincentii]|uniref:Regulatory protein RecX n=1 Tax=Clostridium vincentii TaxID=52704 RepID=A0A2T0BDP4_9CLOT|nr:recombination regulator RecX [Clostridium vincentii]PRR81952.1 Regulatory protein RecX [Clostridium vincentii]